MKILVLEMKDQRILWKNNEMKSSDDNKWLKIKYELSGHTSKNHLLKEDV